MNGTQGVEMLSRPNTHPIKFAARQHPARRHMIDTNRNAPMKKRKVVLREALQLGDHFQSMPEVLKQFDLR